MIKDPALVVSDNTTETSRVIVLNKYNRASPDGLTKLSHVFYEMPAGLIHKEETGIGATTLELEAKRNSIIVEPLRVTAASKSIKHKAFYIGGKTKQILIGISDKQIRQYLLNDTIKHKKFVVVADSLFRLMRVMDELDSTLKSTYFFMIDEIDSFQLDSSFRKSMENCIDIYKSFDVVKRAMVTATLLAFSDPNLNDTLTIIKYDESTYRRIELFYATRLVSAAMVKISEKVSENPAEKIMVAFNSVTLCYDLARQLIASNLLHENEIKILCSNNSSSKVGNFFTELESDVLPGRLNFCTSAYFTGFDLNERYHLISISGSSNKIHTLSDKRLKQIAGRCRNKEGLLSETIIYDSTKILDDKIYTTEDCIKIAQQEISALTCITNNYNGHPLLKLNIDTIRQLIVDSTRINGYRFVRFDSNNEHAISYLNIDAFIEQFKVRKDLYDSEFKLYETLKSAGHIIKMFKKVVEQSTVEKNEIGKLDRIEQVKHVIEVIKNPEITELKLVELQNEEKLTKLQRNIIKYYLDFKGLIAIQRFVMLMQQAGETRDSRKLNNLVLATYYFTLDKNTHYKRTVQHHFPLLSSFTSLELLSRWNIIFIEAGIHKQLETEIQAVRLTKLHYKLIKRKDPLIFFIKKDNPFKLTLLQNQPISQSIKTSKTLEVLITKNT